MKISELESKIELHSLIAEKHDSQQIGNDTYRVNPCPVCSGRDHFTLYPKTNSYSSYSDCTKGGSVYRYLMEVEGMEKDQAYRKLHELAGIAPSGQEAKGSYELDWNDEIGAGYQAQIEKASTATVETEQNNLTDYITNLYDKSMKEYPKQVGEFFLKRGITVNEIMKYKLSVFKDVDGLRAMLPVWSNDKVVYYISRAIEGQHIKYKNAKGIASHFFNMDYLDQPQEEPIIITEGIMDALSLEQAGYKAISINSVANVTKLSEAIRTKPNAQNTIFLTAFDNDEAGQEAAAKLPYKQLQIPPQYNDVNEWHIDSARSAQEDVQGFIDMVVSIDSQIETARQPDAVSDYLEGLFYQDIEKMKPYKDKKTGFANLDKEMNGLYPGLYVVGGISSVGKTTFVHQLGDQLAEQGDHVLFFSLEQSKMEMVSKSLARTTAKTNLNSAVSSVAIRGGYQSEAVSHAIASYQQTGKRVSVIEGNFNTNAQTIRNYVSQYAKNNDTSPIVIVDYLQIMPGISDSMNDKQRVDVNVTELKRMSRDLNLSVFVISSLNRGNYLAPIDFESFKESGGIEYTADVVWGLQLEAINESIFDSAQKIKEKRERLKEAKVENPRQIELVCLKNRNGKPSFSCSFTYWARHDFYEPNKAEGFSLDLSEGKKPKKATAKGGIVHEEVYKGMNRIKTI